MQILQYQGSSHSKQFLTDNNVVGLSFVNKKEIDQYNRLYCVKFFDVSKNTDIYLVESLGLNEK